MTDNPTLTNTKTAFEGNTNPDIKVRATETPDGQIQHLRSDLEAAYKVAVDEGATYTYIGHAEPGTATAASAWRIKRLTNSNSSVVWADGDGDFDNVWDDRVSLVYS